MRKNMSKRPFVPFDDVVYCGEKFRSELRNKVGIVLSKVQNSTNTYVVDFDTASYVLTDDSINHWRSRSREEQSKVEKEIYKARKPVLEE
jgi:hypothetical protein